MKKVFLLLSIVGAIVFSAFIPGQSYANPIDAVDTQQDRIWKTASQIMDRYPPSTYYYRDQYYVGTLLLESATQIAPNVWRGDYAGWVYREQGPIPPNFLDD